jgi:type I restriction enzyme M protein
MISKMEKSPAEGGEGSRIAIVFNGSPLFTGDAGSGECNISSQAFLDNCFEH